MLQELKMKSLKGHAASIIIALALAAGLLLGLAASQGLSALTLSMFSIRVDAFALAFSPRAAVRTVGYFGLIFLLVMLLFSAQAYRTATKGTQQNNNLYTASSYISVKFHQHDSSQSIFTDTVDGSPALCMTDTVNDQQYITYIYLKEYTIRTDGYKYCQSQ